jgi:hypothetical protein
MAVRARLEADDEPGADSDTVGAEPHHLSEPLSAGNTAGRKYRNRDGVANRSKQLLERLGPAHVAAGFDPLRDHIVAAALRSRPRLGC